MIQVLNIKAVNERYRLLLIGLNYVYFHTNIDLGPSVQTIVVKFVLFLNLSI